MGILIAFWSPWPGKGTTANCISAALQFSYKYKNNVIITHTNNKKTTMEAAFLNGNEDESIESMLSFTDVGVDSLERALKTGKLKQKDILSYCNRVNDNLYFLSGSKKTDELFDSSVGFSFKNICEFSKQVNDVTFIDVTSGFNKDVSKRVLDIADVIVVSLDQTNLYCEEFFGNQIENFQRKKPLIMIGRLDYESNYSKKYIDKAFNQDVFILPQLTEYLDAINNHRVNQFFREYSNSEDELFFDELNRFIDEIDDEAYELGVRLERKDIVDTREFKKGKFPFFAKK